MTNHTDLLPVAWEDLSEKTRDVMVALGNFYPTVNPGDCTVKGWTADDCGLEKTYWTSDDLRQIAIACVEVADWLEKRDV